MEKIYVEFNEDQGLNLQLLGTDVDSKVFLIDRLLANHANDTDTQLFDSVPFKHYHKEYEQAFIKYEQAKKDFENNFLKPIVEEQTGKKNVPFTWQIDDFNSGKCEVTLF